MLLVVDAGNTQSVLGVYEGERLLAHWRISTDASKTADEHIVLFRSLLDSAGIDPRQIDAVCISTVVPPMQSPLEEMSMNFFGVRPLVVGPGIKTGLSILYDNPREVGADRIVNAVAAYEQYGGPTVVVDMGTATTFCAISARAEYLGGAIVPGLGIAAEALFTRTAKLPRVALVKPKTVIGKDTVSSIQSGLINGYVDLVDGMVKRISNELGDHPTVVGTGGLINIIASESSTIQHVDQLLTLKGLRVIYHRNLQ
jgi:type III pantothenate kinase